ncbi:hypothetical protein QM716_15915 [Rhodococcus sp. IEGM 1409]|uniref:hypothetical protein n=1 Tax=Rhodococcus sp. IEGM 1409 TaxID=3047082 RepID=UPI0024B78773|nr:hypothetical protein [Rhodococcus sp. IEGM 1409]MDI9901345.1 hypothetical protein [Rhodococcus sp. IEGM 1409]
MTDSTSPARDGNEAGIPLTRDDIVSAVTEALQSVTIQTESKPFTAVNYTINTSDMTFPGLDAFSDKASTPADRGVRKVSPHRRIDVTPEILEAVAEFLFDTGVETPMINSLRSIAACHRVDLDDPVDVVPPSADPTLDELGKQLADALELQSERKLVFHSAQRTQVVAAKRFEDASSAVLDIEKQIRRHVSGEPS